jgi:hypothetical protein
VISRIPSIQLDNLAWLGLGACNLDVQLCRHGPVTVLIAFLNNRLCHYGVLVEFRVITKILQTLIKEKLLKKLPKIFNYQKSQKNREILPKVIKITKSGHTDDAIPRCSAF